MKKYINIAMLIIIVVLTLLLIRGCRNSEKEKNERTRYENNIEALNDSIRVYKNKNGERSFEKMITNMTKDELKIYNKPLYDKIVKEDGKVKIIIETKIEYVDSGTTVTKIAQLDSNKYSANFNYKSMDSVISIKGRSHFYADIKKDKIGKSTVKITPDTTYIDEVKTTIGLTLCIKEIDDKIKVSVTPDSKNVTISSLSGSEIYVTKKVPKRFSVNMSLGCGATINGGKINVSPALIFGIGYNFISF